LRHHSGHFDWRELLGYIPVHGAEGVVPVQAAGRGSSFVKIVVLDIEGVLVTPSCYARCRDAGWAVDADPQCVAALNALTDATGAFLVVSSVRRLEGIMPVKEMLNKWGVTGRVLDCTPRLFKDRPNELAERPRGEEIAAWIEDYPRDVAQLVILDDDVIGGAMAPFQIQTSASAGLTQADVEKAIAKLNQEVPMKLY